MRYSVVDKEGKFWEAKLDKVSRAENEHLEGKRR